MFREEASIELVNSLIPGTLGEQLGMKCTELGEKHICMSMPVDERTFQPMRILHGGASIALAETIGSVASALILDPEKAYPVGLEINGNHIRSCNKGHVHAKATPLHVGRKTHVWDIKITDDRDKLVCVSRITIAVIPK